ncbi:hypothetical protein E0Z10_g382 [Xylaria hypoxylon]|uniref:Uncharacterized protein n=1 Tax=Xylaria hypoxylon TaxID=37992 RepID=A0A4Z0Z857_9PEZI|nr:hypothetical protein E0Z10_g382 [Xylaria hypoxylon]
MRYFDKVEHPFTRALLDIYIEKKKEPLWWSGFAYGASPFPNKTASRRIAHALRDALAAAGYDRFGRRVLVDGESSAIADLYGTLRVSAQKKSYSALKYNFGEIRTVSILKGNHSKTARQNMAHGRVKGDSLITSEGDMRTRTLAASEG